ncbi:unnamed protein product [Urochloa decumbens]|uniref:Beta-glucosidase 12-like n=1 Tax=Urochloa decumbens TaxID=240449 RepID=A0ABC9C8B1_9POAL
MLGRLLLQLLLLAAASEALNGTRHHHHHPISRRRFPEGFIFGTASSAYQYEGAVKEGGRGPSIWDTYSHQHKEKIIDGSNGDVAVDSYHRYKEDVRVMKHMGMDAYRFSISWSRILPNGSLKGGVNKEGVRYYNNLTDELLLKGVQPFVTLFHWDTPQALEDKYGGFLSPNIINDYKDYAEVCFKEFGDRVKHWITFNEPWTFCTSGYASGVAAPGQTVRLYKEKYQATQNGSIGITLIAHWFVDPYSRSKSYYNASRRATDFMLGWFMDPLTKGDYPPIMRALVENRLPQFTKNQSELVKGAFDFIGLNYYTTNYAYNLLPPPSPDKVTYNTDARVNLTGFRNGVPIGPQAASSWLFVYPQGFRELLLYVKEAYGNPTVYITENGIDEANNKSLSLQEALKDHARIEYYRKHFIALQSAIRDGANVKGYFAWSLLDNYEWGNGYSVRFGIYFVNCTDGLKRYPKKSAHWFKNFLKK